MKNQNKPANNIIGFDLFKFFLLDGDKVYLSVDMSPDLIYILIEMLGNKYKFIYCSENPVCPVCGAKLNKNGLTEFKLNKNLIIYKQKYSCSSKKCNHYEIADTTRHIPKYGNYTFKIRERGTYYNAITYSSYGTLSEYVNHDYGTQISRQSIYNYHDENVDSYITEEERKLEQLIKDKDIGFSGYYNYDEEFIKTSGEVKVRMTIVDAHTKRIVNEQLKTEDEFNKKTIEDFFIETFQGKKLNTIITDGYSAYPDIISKLGANHQNCVFHVMQILMKCLQKEVNRLNRKIKSLKNKIKHNKDKIEQLKKQGPIKKGKVNKNDKKIIKNREKRKQLQQQNSQYNEKLRKYKKEVKQLVKCKEQISMIFKAKTLKTALKRFNKLKQNKDKLPQLVCDFIEKLDKKIERSLQHTVDRNIPKTNNLAELVFRTTFPRKIKTIFRTVKGATRQLRLNNIKWTKNNVL